jgi:putative transposase
MKYRHGAHSTYDLKYHIVFCTKYRYRVLTGYIATGTVKFKGEICSANYMDIVSGNISPEHKQ